MNKMGAKIFVNSITMVRVVGTFLLPFIGYNFDAKGLLIYLVVLFLTDTFDGMMARRLKVSTIFGSLLDAAADKLLGIATLALLALSYPIMFLPILIETIIALINTVGATRGASTESSRLGKVKTWILGICIVSGLVTVYSEEFILLFNELTKEGQFFISVFNQIQEYRYIIMNSLAFVCLGTGVMVIYDYSVKVKKEVKKAKKDGIDFKNINLKKGKELIYALFDENYYEETKGQSLLQKLGESRELYERKISKK